MMTKILSLFSNENVKWPCPPWSLIMSLGVFNQYLINLWHLSIVVSRMRAFLISHHASVVRINGFGVYLLITSFWNYLSHVLHNNNNSLVSVAIFSSPSSLTHILRFEVAKIGTSHFYDHGEIQMTE